MQNNKKKNSMKSDPYFYGEVVKEMQKCVRFRQDFNF